MDAEYSVSSLRIYSEHLTTLLDKSSKDFREFTERQERAHKELQRPFDKDYWLKHYDVYSEVYPRFFNNSLIITACALFEFQFKKIVVLVQKEHEIPLGWEDMGKAPILTKAKRFLNLAGITMLDDPSGSLQWLSDDVSSGKGMTIRALWKELDTYFLIRNCIAHHNGLVQRMRYPERITNYALRKGILIDSKDGKIISLTQGFNNEVCDTMMSFFSKLTSAYYSTPLPE